MTSNWSKITMNILEEIICNIVLPALSSMTIFHGTLLLFHITPALLNLVVDRFNGKKRSTEMQPRYPQVIPAATLGYCNLAFK